MAPGGFFDIYPGCERNFHIVHETIHTLGEQYCHDSLIANLNFGFWRYLFALNQYTASGNNLINIFVNRPYGTSQKQVYRLLMKINHEPVCFHGNIVSTANIESRYNTILQLLHWLGCNPSKILYGIDGVHQPLKTIKRIQTLINSRSKL